MKNNRKKGICGICPAGCWVEILFDQNGKIDKVIPDNSSQLGMICTLGEHSAEIVYSKDRIKYPMRRKGSKGNFEFERISWDDAYSEIVSNLNSIKNESGPEATAIYTGRGSFELSMCDIFQPKDVAVSSASSVLFPFGSPNTLGVGALCYVSFAMIAPHTTMGGMLINMFSDIENSEIIIVWGANPATDSPPLDYNRIIEAHKKGTKIVVIDPRKTKTAKATNAEWIPIRPGTDGALALGMCNIIIQEELYDEKFVDNWTHGFAEFSKYVQHFTPEVVENITNVPANTMSSLARRIAIADGASPIMYSGLEYSNSGVQAIRATMTLWALAGQLDVPGGRCFTMKENQFPINRKGHISNPDKKKALGLEKFPVYSSYRGESHAISLPDSVLNSNPYKIKSLIILGGSIITSWPQPEIWRKTLDALDFLVCIDRQLTADAAYADIVLPATTMYEIQSYMTYGPIFRIREKIIEPVGEARNDYFILAELAKRLGYGHLYPQTEEEVLQYVLSDSKYTPNDVRTAGGTIKISGTMMQYKKWEKGLLRSDGKPGFDTPTGKFEFSSEILEEHGYDPLPIYTEPKEGPLSQPELTNKYPLVFNSGSRVVSDFRSQHHGIPGLLKKRPEPLVTINSIDAEHRGIKTGDLVNIVSKRNKLAMRAFVTNDIIQGAIDADMGGGGPVGSKEWKECNINDLTDLQNYDPISGFPVYKALLCEIEKLPDNYKEVNFETTKSEVFDSAEIENERLPEIKNRIYLDHNATTPINSEVKKIMAEYLENGQGNPSGIYLEGKSSRFSIESARRSVARLINCTAKRIIFTGSGSEANNLAIKGIAYANKKSKNHIITTSIEHPSVINTCKWLENNGFIVTYLPVSNMGLVDPDDLKSNIRPETCFISIMTANNETGTIQPINQFSEIAKENGIIFHTDAVQAAGKIPIDVQSSDVDLLTISGHKFHGPKGIGALYHKKGIKFDSLIHGGKQENALRAGTENVLAIVGFGKASEIAVKRLQEMKKIKEIRDYFEKEIINLIPEATINGHPTTRLPSTLNIILPNMRGESVVLALDQKGVALSSGSACRAGSPDPSHALLAMGLSEEEAHCSVRFSLGIHNTIDEIKKTIQYLKEVISESENTVRFIPCR